MKNFRYLNILLVIIVLGVATSVDAATFTVTNTNDSGAGSLRQAILDSNGAAGDDVINFDAGVFNTARTINITSPMRILGSGSVTINGPGSDKLTVNGNEQTRGFIIDGNNSSNAIVANFNDLTIKSMILPGGTNNNYGAAIGINPDSSAVSAPTIAVNVDKVVFLSNRGTGAGMGCRAAAEDGTVVTTITNSVFRDNGFSGSGGAIETGSGDTGGGGCSWVIDSSLFEKNVAGDFGGGAISGGSSNDDGVDISNSTFIGNRAGSGSALFIVGASSIRNSTFINNRSEQGSTIAFGAFQGDVDNITVVNNFTESINASAGISIVGGSNVRLKNSIIANNSNNGGNNLDIWAFGEAIMSEGFNLIENPGTRIDGDTTGNITGVDPRLDGVARLYGGTVKTLALLPGSPAIDAADPNDFPTSDQRGFARPVDGDGNGSSLPDIGAFELQTTDVVPANKFDFDGDSKSDISIFRPGPNPAQYWLLRSSDGGNNAFSFGLGSDKPVPADYTGDGKTDLAFFRESTNEWFVLRSEDSTFYSFPFGATGDIPAPGDFDGDGIADSAVFRPSSSTWFINRSSDGNTDIVGFGIPEDKPVVADYDGDGKDDIAIYRPSVSQWWINRSSEGNLVFQFGQTGDKTVHGDYTGDGKADVAFWRPTTGEWFVIRSEDQSFFSFTFGASGDIPAPGDYDGDGTFDATVFRPSSTTWFVNGSTSGTQIVGFGLSSDVPLANSFVTE